MHNLTIPQAMRLWGDLVEAYHGVNGFGGHTAEIYVYRAIHSWPLFRLEDLQTRPFPKDVREVYEAANKSLLAVFRQFEETYDATVRIVNDRRAASSGLTLDEFAASIICEPYTHRLHVFVDKR